MRVLLLFLIAVGLVLSGCCKEDFITPSGNDFRSGAADVTDLLGACSDDEAYTTAGATADGEGNNCGDPDNNVWFKITATDTEELWIYIHVGSTYGTQRHTILTLWDTNGITPLECQSAYGPEDYVYISYSPVTSGEQYYFSVDTGTSDGAGTFTICLDDTD